ncbi:MAG: alpha-galactosidase [Saccharofermentanales bacterium]
MINCETENPMKVLYRIDYGQDVHRSTLNAHTTETGADGQQTAVYRRFLDARAQLQLQIHRVTDPALGVHRLTAQLTNTTSQPVVLRRLDVGAVLPAAEADLHYFTSDWGSEFTPLVHHLAGPFTIAVTAGRSSKGFIPWAGLTTPDRAWSMALGWSGSWLCEAEPEPFGGTIHLTMGISGEGFATTVEQGATYTSAPIYLAEGRTPEDASLALRRYFRRHLSLLRDASIPDVPLEFNGWWPYEDRFINESVFWENARLAKELGCRYAVMDAGWFGQSDETQNWYDKRGDWSVINDRDFPSGIKALCDKTKEIGLLPGLWCEIEAVGFRASLLEEHPEIIARRDGRSLGYVCLGNEAGVEWALAVIDTILGTYGARWIKFDYNLDPAPGCNQPGHGHGDGDGLLAHYTNYYRLLDTVHRRYPDVVIENCSSGGLRLDIEMMSHTHWTHLSDPDYTELHLQCFWGALSYLHQSACLHFSWSQILGGHNIGISNPITADMDPVRFDWIIRAVLMGIPGFSYRLPDLPQWCMARLKEHCSFYAGIYHDFIRDGDIHRLTGQPVIGGKGERFPVFALCSGSQEAILFAFRLDGAPADQNVCLRGLDPEAMYETGWFDQKTCTAAVGGDLMRTGIRIGGLGENTSEIIRIRKISKGKPNVR